MIRRIAEATPGARIDHDEPFLESVGLSDEASQSWAEAIVVAGRRMGHAPRCVAARYGTNASVLASAGVPSVVFGPGSIAQAHTADEWIALDQVAAAAVILVDCVATPLATGTQKQAVTS